jgi:hypothetical protein
MITRAGAKTVLDLEMRVLKPNKEPAVLMRTRSIARTGWRGGKGGTANGWPEVG